MTNDTHSFTPSGAPVFQKKTLDADEVKNYLYSWKRAGFTATQELRILKLFLGWNEFMDINGQYPYCYFVDLAKVFHYDSTKRFVEKITLCDGFGFIWDSKEHTPSHLIAFYSPICLQGDPYHELGVANPEFGVANPEFGDGYNITKKNIKKKVITDPKPGIGDGKVEKKKEKGTETTKDEAMEVKSAIANFFEHLYTDHYAYLAFVQPVNKKTELLLPNLKQASNEEQPVNVATRHFFEYYLGRYFTENGKSFIKTSLEGKKCWLRRVMEKSFTNRNITHAVDDIRRDLNHNAGMLMRQNHKFSAYEYLDPQTQIRLYDETRPDGTLEQVQIPAGAPPRPSDTATWDNWGRCWRNRTTTIKS